MFCNKVSLLRNLTSNIRLRTQFYNGYSNYTAGKSTNEFEEVQEIESSLFENSNRRISSPIDTAKLLQQYNKKQPRNKWIKNKFQNKKLERKEESPKKLEKPEKVKSDKLFDNELGLSYMKLHLNDPWLSSLMMSVNSKKYRAKKHQLLVEGRRLIFEAIHKGLSLDYLLFSDKEKLKQIIPELPAETKVVKVPQHDLKFWSTLSTCPGLIGIFEKPHDMSSIIKSNRVHLPITVICDQIREPNNIGSIVRNCAAASCKQVIVMKGCADPWESKALRGGAGAQFYIPIRGPMDWSSLSSFLPANDYSLYLSENNLENARRLIDQRHHQALIVPYANATLDGQKEIVIVIGGETEGISESAYDLFNSKSHGQCIHIPLADGIDSLNTSSALAVVLFEMKKQLQQAAAK